MSQSYESRPLPPEVWQSINERKAEEENNLGFFVANIDQIVRDMHLGNLAAEKAMEAYRYMLAHPDDPNAVALLDTAVDEYMTL